MIPTHKMQSESIVLAHIMFDRAVGMTKHTPIEIHALLVRNGYEYSLYFVRKCFRVMTDNAILDYRGNHYVVNVDSGVLTDIIGGMNSFKNGEF